MPSLLVCLGVAERVDEASRPNYDAKLDPAARAAIAAATGVAATRIRGLTLTRYNGRALDLRGFKARVDRANARVAAREWCYFNDSGFCPDCLRERGGAWRLGWRLPWTFACARHMSLLVDRCQACGVRPGERQDARRRGNSALPISLVPEPGRCTTPHARHRRCEARLALAFSYPLDPGSRVLATQRVIDDALTEWPRRTAHAFFAELRSLTALLLLGATAEDLGSLPPDVAATFEGFERARRDAQREGSGWRVWAPAPRGAALLAAVAATALELQRDTPADAAARLAPIARRLRDAHNPYAYTAPRLFQFSERLQTTYWTALNRDGQRLYRLHVKSRRGQRRAGRIPTLDPDRVPQMIPADEYDAHFRALLPGVTAEVGRRFVATALVKLTTGRSWRDAARILGCPLKAPLNVMLATLRELTGADQAEAFFERLATLADRLDADPAPTDYGALRRALADLTDLTHDEWSAICEHEPLDRRDGAGGRLSQQQDPRVIAARKRFLAAWIWSDSTQGWWRWAPALQPPARGRAARYTQWTKLTITGREAGIRAAADHAVLVPRLAADA